MGFLSGIISSIGHGIGDVFSGIEHGVSGLVKGIGSNPLGALALLGGGYALGGGDLLGLFGGGGGAAAGSGSALDAYLTSGGVNGSIMGGEGGFAGAAGSMGTGALGGSEALGLYGGNVGPLAGILGRMGSAGTDIASKLSGSLSSSLGTRSGMFGLAQAGGGLYGLLQAQQLRKQMQLPDPGSVTSLPGYQAGLEAVQRSMAAQGYGGSGNMMAALSKYGGDFYNQAVQQRIASGTAQEGPLLGSIGGLGLLLSGLGKGG